jgi:UDP-glucose 4-epimerase
LKSQRVLLTGGTGYIGSHTATVLAQAGHMVVLYDNLCNSKASVVDRLETILGQPLTFIEGDVRDTAKLEDSLRQHQIDAVIHFAGLKAVGESMQKPLAYFDANINGTLSLLKAMESTGVERLVFSSSATVYGAPQYLPLDEEHPTRATNPYGRSKLHIEELLADVAKANGHLRVVCLRYFNPVGAHESGLIGEDPSDIPNNLMPYIAKVASGSLAHLNVFGNDYPTPDGTGIRDYIHVLDVAEGHCAALSFLEDHRGWTAINLGAGTGYSVFDMLRAFEGVVGRSIPTQITSRRPGDVASCYADVNKARALLRWKASRGLHEMCESAWRFQVKAGAL